MWAEDWASERSVVCFKAAFTLEASLLCIHGVAAGAINFADWARQLPSHYTL
jgi:hypothetical protein